MFFCFFTEAMSDLTICKLSDCSATVAGGREIILLCEKVAKEDIQVRFYEEVDGDVTWEAQGDFTPTHVHKQVAISFRTPKYRDLDADKPVKVWVQLRRPSDGATSEPVPFLLTPLDAGRPAFWSLHRALAKKGDYGTFTEILTAEAQKRKLDAISPDSETKKKKDSLISGGGLISLPLTVYDSEPKEITKPQPEEQQMEVDSKKGSFVYDEKEKDSLDELMDHASEIESLLEKPKDDLSKKDDNSFDDLITQVAELDEIYSDARTRLQLEELPAIHCAELFDDSQTYTSLQLAMKNPIEVEIAYNEPQGKNEKLPPLPPKRVKQVAPGRPDALPPVRDLPSKPRATIFSKLFARKGKRHSVSTESLKRNNSKASLDDISPKNSEKGFSKWFHRGSTGSLVVAHNDAKDSLDIDLDLTEAENYALYTTTAPHASVSEFDEMSSYYSPVEGGRILRDFQPKPQNVSS